MSVDAVVVLLCAVLCVIASFQIYKEFKPIIHHHSFGVYLVELSIADLFEDAQCWCSQTIPVYEAIARGVPLTSYLTNKVLVPSADVLAESKAIYYPM